MTAINPNWPNLFVEGQFGANTYLSPLGATLPYTELSKRLYKTWTTQRGKQFELDSVQAGEFQGSFINTDGALDPANTGSPLYPNVLPYRGLRFRAQYPPSINMLDPNMATGGENTSLAAGTSGSTYGISGAYGGFLVTASGTAYQGTQVWQFTGTTPSAGSAIVICAAAGIGQRDGLPYTQAIHVRSVTGGANPQVQPFIQWVDALGNVLSTVTGGTSTLTGNVAASWTATSVTATMPTTGLNVSMVFGLNLTSAPAGTWSLQVDGIQLEQNSSASAFVVPGTNYHLLSALAERYPQDWDYNGTYGFVSPIGVDVMAILSQNVLPAPFVADVLELAPNFLFQLNDSADSTYCTDSAGKRPPAPIENSPYGAGSLVLGSSITSVTPAGTFVGTPGPVATFNNNSSATGSLQFAETYISLHKTTATPGPSVNGNWTRVVHFRAPATVGVLNTFAVWEANSPTYSLNVGGGVGFSINASTGLFGGNIQMGVTVPGGGALFTGNSVFVADGDWHQAAISLDTSGNVAFYVDGVAHATNSGSSPVTMPLVPMTADAIGASVSFGAGNYNSGMKGDIALAAEFPSVLTPTQITNLYNSWRSAYLGESSGSRYGRILGWGGYVGSTAIDTGATTSMGPATDVSGVDALTALQNVVNTENGQHFMSTAGAMTFQARTRRYGQTTPTYIFGDANPIGSEIPYESLSFDFDTTHLSNSVQVTQVSTGQIASAQDVSSQANYGERTLTRDNQSTSLNECQDAASYLIYRYKDPHLRIATMRLHPSSNPSLLFPVCLSLELGMRVRVIRRPPSPAAPIQLDGFIEAIVHTPDDNGEWYTDIQISPADTLQYWGLAALHTTLHAQATSGTNAASINALPDAAVNVLASSLPSGYQLVFEPGTVRQETMTLASGGIPTTTLGYTSATLTFTSNFGFTHAANSTVCEPLPAGFTDPTTWDASSILGASYTTVLSGGGSGTSTVVVNAMSDFAANGLGQDWIPGDTLWLSPGTANFETAVILSVSTTYPNYSSATITFTANLTHSHAVGDYVCEPLPGGMTNPTALTPAPTARLAY